MKEKTTRMIRRSISESMDHKTTLRIQSALKAAAPSDHQGKVQPGPRNNAGAPSRQQPNAHSRRATGSKDAETIEHLMYGAVLIE